MSDADAQVIQLQRLLAAAQARAEAAERKVAAGLAALDAPMMPPVPHKIGARFESYVTGAADLSRRVRAALDTAADLDTPTPTRWERA